LPSEIITLIGQENLDKLDPFGQRAVVASLLEMYLKEGLDWMREKGWGGMPGHSSNGPGVPFGIWGSTYRALTFDHEPIKKNLGNLAK